jgi:hypothetical protein
MTTNTQNTRAEGALPWEPRCSLRSKLTALHWSRRALVRQHDHAMKLAAPAARFETAG